MKLGMPLTEPIKSVKGYLPKLGEMEAKFERRPVYSGIEAYASSTSRRVGSETYCILGDKIHGNYISADEAFQKQGVGEFVRAASLVEMLTYGGGKIKKFIIESMPNAEGFHRKYGFKPYVKNYDIKKGLATLNYDRRLLVQPLKARAKELFDAGKTEELQTLINEYMKEVRTAMGSNLIPLKLTRQDILDNPEFYNKLFEKNGIDFQI